MNELQGVWATCIICKRTAGAAIICNAWKWRVCMSGLGACVISSLERGLNMYFLLNPDRYALYNHWFNVGCDVAISKLAHGIPRIRRMTVCLTLPFNDVLQELN